jgi:uncharacterized BrkB/YihY/UPF0761 family membrane protein
MSPWVSSTGLSKFDASINAIFSRSLPRSVRSPRLPVVGSMLVGSLAVIWGIADFESYRWNNRS